MKQIRKELTRIVTELRKSNLIYHNDFEPVSVANPLIMHDGKVYKRKKIILASRGCIIPTCTMCPFPNQSFLRPVSHDNLLSQFYSSFAQGEMLDDFEMISVYNSGNWFADEEIPPSVRINIYESIAKSNCQGIIVESLPQFVTPMRIKEAKCILGKKQLIVALGLQSANDIIRYYCVNTTCTRRQFENATNLLRDNDFSPKVYLMLKPPFLTESEALKDIQESIKYVVDIGYESVAISPTRVVRDTITFELWKLGLYSSPSLWSIRDAILDSKERHPKISIMITCVNKDFKEDNSDRPQNCPKCTFEIREEIDKFNISQDISRLCNLNCECIEDHHQNLTLVDNRSIIQRVSEFISSYQ